MRPLLLRKAYRSFSGCRSAFVRSTSRTVGPEYLRATSLESCVVLSATGPEETLDQLVRRTDGPQPWRRAVHVLVGCCVAWIVYVLGPHAPSTRWLFGTALAVAFMGDLARWRSPAFNRFIFRTFRVLMCPREAYRPSLTWFLLGVFLVLWFPEGLAVPSLLVLALADPAASVVGRLWGTHSLGKGSLEGAVAFSATTLLVLTPFVGLLAALPVAIVVACAEVLPGPHDDNVLIPVVTAACLWILGVGS